MEKGHSVQRIVLIALSAIMALVLAIPMASGQETRNLADLTAEWWNWASQSPSSVEGSYTGGPRCEGEYVDGVFFLSTSFATDPVKRTCTVPANMPILFPVVNVLCSEITGDAPPFDECATRNTNLTVDPPSTWYSRLDGKKLERQRIASGLFQWTVESDNPFGLEAGTYAAGSDGLWVFLEEGLEPGKHKIVFGGTYEDTPFNTPDNPRFKAAGVTYKLTAVV
jgi:hypothetical protein